MEDPEDTLAFRWGIVAKAGVVVVALALLKYVLHQREWEVETSWQLLTSIVGGAVFTLAILLAGVLSDFKESERLVSELASQIRRLKADAAGLGSHRHGITNRIHAQLGTIVGAFNRAFEGRAQWSQREMDAPVAAIDEALVEANDAGAPSSTVRTLQVGMGNLVRIVDRLEFIVETTFLRSGYYFAATVLALCLAGLTLSRISPFGPGMFLFVIASFLLIGIFLLIHDLDNPFDGNARISTRQMRRLAADLQLTPPTP